MIVTLTPNPSLDRTIELGEPRARGEVATLGSRGAVLVTAEGAWLATAPPIVARSTVGAGDSSLAGYLLSDIAGASAADCLRQAAAHGVAAASLPGSTVPALENSDPTAVTVTALPTHPREDDQ